MLGTEYLHTCTCSFFDHGCNNFLLCFDDSFSSKCCLQDRIKVMCGLWLAAMLRKIRGFPKPVRKIILKKMLIFLSINSAIIAELIERKILMQIKSLYTKFPHYKSWDLPKTPPSSQIKGARWVMDNYGASIHKKMKAALWLAVS